MDIVVTNAGRAALINAANTGTAAVIITQVGFSNSAIVPTPAMTALAGEFKRIPGVPGEVVADDIIHVNATDASADAYELRSFALYLADNTLFALYSQPAPILEKTASSTAALSIDAVFADINAAQITFGATNFTNPPATTERQGVVELATVAETKAGIDALRALTPASAQAAILGWLLAQDGAGSGVDADMLDGQHGSWYADIIARLGYTPLDRAGGTMTGPLLLAANPTAVLGAAPKQYVDGLVTAAALLAKLLTVDGSGSGLDADLLDGRDSSWFSDIVARLGFTPANRAGDTFSGTVLIGSLGGNRAEARASGDLVTRTDGDRGIVRFGDSSTRYIEYSGSRYYFNECEIFAGPSNSLVCNAGNDGSGSGFDADMLDGLHASDFLRALAFTNGQNGALRLSNGFLMTWGRWTSSASAGAATNISFHTSFSAEPYALMLLPVVTSSATISVWSSDGISGSSFPGRCSQASIGCRYLAIGPA